MSFKEFIRERAIKFLNLKESVAPFDKWEKENWRNYTKRGDDSNSTREEKVKKSFEAWERNPLAETAIEYKVAYILGKGIEYSCKHLEVQEAIDGFWKENQFDTLQFELVREIGLSGEIFGWFPGSRKKEKKKIEEQKDDKKSKLQIGNIPIIIPVDSTEIKYIARNPQDQRKPSYYHRQYIVQEYPSFDENASMLVASTTTKDENIPAEEMIHFKIGGLTNLSRGRGWLNRVLDWIDEYKAFVNIRKTIHRAKCALAWVFKIATDNQKDIDAMQTKVDNFAKYDRDSNERETIPIGQPIIIGKSMEVNTVNSNINAGTAYEDGHAIKGMVAAGTKLPEYMFGSGYDANLATAQAQDSPMVKCMELNQELIRVMFKQIFDFALQIMIDLGDLKETYEIKGTDSEGKEITIQKTPQELYDLTFPEIAIKDIVPLAQAIAILVEKKILSRELAVTLLGYEWDVEKERIKKEQEEGFASVPSSPFSFPSLMGETKESIDKDDLKKITILSTECRNALLDNYKVYQKNLLEGLPHAKEIFVATQQEIMKKYLEQGAISGYANQAIKNFE